MKELGLPVTSSESIQGITNLRVYLQENPNVYVKISKWRGTIETFYSKTYQLVKPELDEIEHKLGPLAEKIEFLVEQPIEDSVEIGWDGHIVNGEYPTQILAGCEIKDKAYIGEFIKYSELSKNITEFNTSMVDTFAQYEYMGWLSSEIRVKSGKAYMIDATCRVPCPPGQIYELMYENYADIIWQGANGVLVDPIEKAKYGVELLLESEWAICNFQPVYFPERYTENIKLKKSTKIDGVNYIIPQLYGSNDIGSIVTIDDDLEKAVKDIIEIAKSIEGNGIHVRVDALDTGIEEYNKFAKMNKADKSA